VEGNAVIFLLLCIPHDTARNTLDVSSFVSRFASNDSSERNVAGLSRCGQPIARKATAVFCASPRDTVARESCDLIEVNSFYDSDRRLVFDQLLFFDWSHDAGRYQLRAWRMVKNQNQLPTFSTTRGCFECRWQDGVLERVISTKVTRHTNTQYDPELTERAHLAKENRRELRRAVLR
jgi:hypothetical protein